MAASLGSLVVSLGLNAAEFTTGLTKSEAQARRFAQTLDRGIATAATVAGSALVVMGGAAIAALAAVNNLSRQAGNFQDLAEKVGTNAEALAGFAVALNVTGKSADDLADFSVKLSKNLAGVSDGTDKAGAALISLGLNIKEFKALDPAKQIDELSKALAKFSDQGGGKAAALEAIGKGGANLLPFLKELNEAGGRQVILTQAQIEQADKYSDAQARAKEQLILYAQVVAVKMLPAITALTTAGKEFLKELLDTDKATTDLANGSAIETWADNGARAIAKLVDGAQGIGRVFELVGNTIAAGAAQTAAVAVGDFSRALSIGRDFLEQTQKIATRPLFSAKLENAIKNRDTGGSSGAAGGGRPPLKFDGVIADGSKAVLDGQIKALDAAIQRERDILNAREDFLQHYYSQGLLSVEQYFSNVQGARDTELKNVLAFYDQQIAVQEEFKRRANASQRDAADIKISDIREKQTRLIAAAGFAEDKLGRQREVDAQNYLDQLGEINAKILDIAGNTAAAAGIRFDAQNSLLKNQLTSAGNTAGLDQLAQIRAQQQAVIALGEAQRVYSNKVEETSIALARIDLLQAGGSITEIDAINKKAAAATKYVAILTAELEALKKIAENPALGAAARDAASLQIKKLGLEIDQLSLQTDALAKKFNDIGSGAFSTFLQDLVGRTKTVKQAFLDMGKTITQQLNKIASDDIAQRLFGKGGELSGFGDFFSKAFSGGKAADGGVAASGSATLAAAGTTLETAGLSLDTAGLGLDTAGLGLEAAGLSVEVAATAMLAAAEAIIAANAAKAVGDVASSAAGLAGAFAGAAAGGGDIPGNKITLVGERGPELFVPKGAGTIIPNDVLEQRRAARGNTTTVVNNITVERGASTESVNQAATRVGRQTQIALRKRR